MLHFREFSTCHQKPKYVINRAGVPCVTLSYCQYWCVIVTCRLVLYRRYIQ